ncbi:MAG: NADH-quinone oxidoreductase subunit C [Pseudomonadota bacterium]|uniref:NADH-quinone oxidoreductase subunit C n=1 Tax=Thermithiobacillus tepidarius TaxID=929 RepID=UPI00042A3EDE|nr:NADH-quinone oxidoreductase subunit C [Thermithiobacillus tepidarius]
MSQYLENLSTRIQELLGDKVRNARLALGELTVELAREDLAQSCLALRDDAACRFEQLIDLCGVDYLEYGDGAWTGPRFAVVYHLLSVSLNQRVRLRVFLDDDAPVLASVNDVWSSANWFEREAFDLYGIIFEGHPDLRRILTDYGFVGHPFRKDFPLVGLVEMRYDADRQRVVYEPTSTEERNNVPRIIREEPNLHG